MNKTGCESDDRCVIICQMKRGYLFPSVLILLGLLMWIPRQRSMKITDHFVFSRHNGWYLRIASSAGIIRVSWASDDPYSGGFQWRTAPQGAFLIISPGKYSHWGESNVGEIPVPPKGVFAVSYIAILSLSLGLGLLLAVNRWRKDVRQRTSLENRICVKCGYDLRASGDRCPECGTLQQLLSR